LRRIYIAILIASFFLAVPLSAQEVFVPGDNQAAQQTRSDLAKYTRYKSGSDIEHGTLFVTEISWSPDFLSPATKAVSMKLLSRKGRLLWEKTEPIGSRSEQAVVQDLLKELAKANPRLSEDEKTTAEGARQSK
jgi:hypothetical protein